MKTRGFTLLELLVAISVLAIVSLIAWRGLDSLVSTRERLGPEGDDLRALLTVFGQLERDVARAAQPAFFALSDRPIAIRPSSLGPVLQITRVAPASESDITAVQQVFYRLEDGQLLRQSTPPLRDTRAIDAEQMTNVRLLPNVKSLRFREWRDSAAGWIDPTADTGAGTTTESTPGTSGTGPAAGPTAGSGTPLTPLGAGAIPQAQIPPGIEVQIERTDGRIYRRVLLTG